MGKLSQQIKSFLPEWVIAKHCDLLCDDNWWRRVQRRDVEHISRLIESWCEPNIKGKGDATALHFAAKSGVP